MSDKILLSHGSGGEESRSLITTLFLKYFKNSILEELEDSSVLGKIDNVAFTTDSFVVSPIFFNGGDIGKISIAGSINDLSMRGAKPLFISCSFIIEEGFSLKDLEKIVISMSNEAKKSGVLIVTGDTKVVPRGSCDKIFITTSAIGDIKQQNLSARNIEVGDAIILTGSVGDHGASILTAREDLSFASSLKSDCASLWKAVEVLISNSLCIKAMRDATRGGISGVLNEWAGASKKTIKIYQDKILVKDEVSGVCELLGFNPYSLANEGLFLIAISKLDATKALDILKKIDITSSSSIIGEVVSSSKVGEVILNNSWGVDTFLEPPAGELLPRIC